MGVRAVAIQTCDRCQKPFEERHLQACEEVPVFEQEGLLVETTKGTNKDSVRKRTEVVLFQDLCPDCWNVVLNLISRIRLETQCSDRRPVAKRRTRSKEKNNSKLKLKSPDGSASKFHVYEHVNEDLSEAGETRKDSVGAIGTECVSGKLEVVSNE